MKVIHLPRRDVPECILRALPEYQGRKFSVELNTNVQHDGAYWDGGCRSVYIAVRLSTGETSSAHPGLSNPPQSGGPQTSPEVEIPKGVVVVEHHQGYPNHVIIHARPDDYQPLLPPGPTLTEDEKTVLATGGSNLRFAEAQARTNITRPRWDKARNDLIARKLLDKRGVVTITGRNALSFE